MPSALTNDFEAYATGTGDAVADGWILGSGYAQWDVSTTQAHGGTKSLHLNGFSGFFNGDTAKKFTPALCNQIDLTFWVYLTSGSIQPGFHFVVGNSEGSSLATGNSHSGVSVRIVGTGSGTAATLEAESFPGGSLFGSPVTENIRGGWAKIRFVATFQQGATDGAAQIYVNDVSVYNRTDLGNFDIVDNTIDYVEIAATSNHVYVDDISLSYTTITGQRLAGIAIGHKPRVLASRAILLSTDINEYILDDEDVIELRAGEIRLNGTVFVSSGGGTNALLDGVNHTDTTNSPVTKGDLVVGNSTPKWDDLPVGTDGQVLTADSAQTLGMRWATPGSGGGDSTVLKTSDETITSDATLSNDSALTFPVDANSYYDVEISLLVNTTGTSGTADWQFALSLPASTTGFWGYSSSVSSTATTWSTNSLGGTPTALSAIGATLTAGSATGSTYPFWFKAIIITGGTSGNVTLQWAQNTSHSGNNTVKAGSFLRYRKLN